MPLWGCRAKKGAMIARGVDVGPCPVPSVLLVRGAARVVELVDALDSKSSTARCVGSSPTSGTTEFRRPVCAPQSQGRTLASRLSRLESARLPGRSTAFN